MKTTITEAKILELFNSWWLEDGQFVCASGQDNQKQVILDAWRSGFNASPRVPTAGIHCCDCPQHPDALIRHTCDLTQTVLNGMPSGEGVASNHKYFCADCDRELLSLKDAGIITSAAQRIASDFERAAKNILNGWPN